MNRAFFSLSNPVWLRLARTLTLLVTLFLLGVFIAGLLAYPGYASRNPDEFPIYGWNVEQMDRMLQRAGLSYEWWLGFHLVINVITASSFFGIAALLFLRKRSDWFGLYLAFILFLFGLVITPALTAISGVVPILDGILTALSVLAWPLFFIIFFLFPDGHFVPGWTRWAALVFVMMTAYGLITSPDSAPPMPIMLATFILVGIGVWSQVYRYRRYSNPVHRQQTKWVVFSILFFFGTLLLALWPLLYPAALDPDQPMALVILFLTGITSLVAMVIPFSIAIAILRYRLYDIDVIIRKTLVYTLVTGLLGLVYLGGVLLLQSLFALPGTGQSPAALVLSTLLIAALFNPLRRHVQEGVDRRFYRKKYDAEGVLAAFASLARDEVDIERLSAALVGAVEETVQPVETSLWLRSLPGQLNRSGAPADRDLEANLG